MRGDQRLKHVHWNKTIVLLITQYEYCMQFNSTQTTSSSLPSFLRDFGRGAEESRCVFFPAWQMWPRLRRRLFARRPSGTYLLLALPTFLQPRRIISPKYCAVPFHVQSVCFSISWEEISPQLLSWRRPLHRKGDEARGIELPQRKLSAEWMKAELAVDFTLKRISFQCKICR